MEEGRGDLYRVASGAPADRLLLLLKNAGVPCKQWTPSLGLWLAIRAVSALAVWQKLLLAVVRAQ